MKIDPAIEKDLEKLQELGAEAKKLRYLPGGAEVRMERDGLIYRLAWDGVSASAIAEVADVHRVFVYRVKDNYVARLRRWEARQKK